MPPLPALDVILRYWKQIVGGAALVIILYQRQEIAILKAKEAAIVYEHPQVQKAEQSVTTQAPTIVHDKVYQMTWQDFAKHNPDEAAKLVAAQPYSVVPFGVQVTEHDETIGASTTTTATAESSKVVPLSIAMAPVRTDRYLASLMVDPVRRHDLHGYTALAGYSWDNRVDLLGGWGGDGWKVQVVLRR